VNISGSYVMNHSMQINRVYTLRYVVFDICSDNYSIMYQKSNAQEENIRKRRAQGGENSLTGGCPGHSTRWGPGQAQGQG